jgi:hypothetical protein
MAYFLAKFVDVGDGETLNSERLLVFETQTEALAEARKICFPYFYLLDPDWSVYVLHPGDVSGSEPSEDSEDPLYKTYNGVLIGAYGVFVGASTGSLNAGCRYGTVELYLLDTGKINSYVTLIQRLRDLPMSNVSETVFNHVAECVAECFDISSVCRTAAWKLVLEREEKGR